MRIQVLSDIHGEFIPSRPPLADADLLVVAGDGVGGLVSGDWARSSAICSIHVPDDHCRETDKLRVRRGPLACLLDEGSAVIDGVRFLGGTLGAGQGVDWLRALLAEQHAGPTVVVTYHAPPEQLVLASCVTMWLHGNAAGSVNRQLGGTRVIANPHGRQGRGLNPEFDPQLVVDV